jgi:hypothetical protein
MKEQKATSKSGGGGFKQPKPPVVTHTNKGGKK